jgi:signal transduction histidine kinase
MSVSEALSNVRILVVDDHELVRRGICTVLSSDPNVTVSAEAADGRQAVEKARAIHPDVVIMDISMPNMNGIEATREIKRLVPETEIVIVSQHESPEMVRQAFNAGARGYVVKSAISDDLLAAISKVAQHQTFVKGGGADLTKQNPSAGIGHPESKPADGSNLELHRLVHTLEAEIAERTRELETATDKLRELSGRLLQTQDEERRRIARELHDGVGQLLTALGMNLSSVTSEKHKLSPGAVQALNENVKLIKQASQELRTMSHLLHPPLLDEVGLESALRWYVDGFAERSNITVKMQLVQGFSKGLPRDLALSLFRIVQECLTNVHRHSGSLTALVKIERSEREITLEVTDEGRGISSELQTRISSGASSGVGLRGMRERIRQFDGRLEVESDHGGTKIIAVAPIPDSAGETAEISEAEGAHGDEKRRGASGAEAPEERPATILCIDDEPAGLLPRKLLLESAGYRVIEARSGLEGVQLFQSERVDAVVLDYWMSGMKGTAVAAELKRINAAVPVIMLSGMGDLPGEVSGLIDQWIVKGSSRAEQLLDSVKALLERRSV